MPILPDADPGILKGRVAPIHGLEARIGTGGPAAVAQPQGGQQHGESAACPIGGVISCPPTPDVGWALALRSRRRGSRAGKALASRDWWRTFPMRRCLRQTGDLGRSGPSDTLATGPP